MPEKVPNLHARSIWSSHRIIASDDMSCLSVSVWAASFLMAGYLTGVYPGRLQPVSRCSPFPLAPPQRNKAVWVHHQLRSVKYYWLRGLLLFKDNWTLHHCELTTQTASVAAGLMNELRYTAFIGSAAAAAVLQLERRAILHSNELDWRKVYGLCCGCLLVYFARQSREACCQVCSTFKGVETVSAERERYKCCWCHVSTQHIFTKFCSFLFQYLVAARWTV